MLDKLRAVVSADGKTMKWIYSDELASLAKEGKTKIERVSNVEPTADGKWQAIMKDGTVLGKHDLRQQALDEEVSYLEAKLFGAKEAKE